MHLKMFVKQQHSEAVHVKSYWHELLFDGKNRLDKEMLQETIHYFYRRLSLKPPAVQLSHNPLEHSCRVMDYKLRQQRSQKFYKSKAKISFFYFWESMLKRWNRKIAMAIDDYAPYSSIKARTQPFFKRPCPELDFSYSDIDPYIGMIFPSLYHGVHYRIADSIHDMLLNCLCNRDNGISTFNNEYAYWTGNKPLIDTTIFFKGKRPLGIQAIQSNFENELHSLYAVIPLYDFFSRTGILQDEEFKFLSALLQAGLLSFLPYEDVCFASALPQKIQVNDGKLHASRHAAVCFDGGFQLFFCDGKFFPAKMFQRAIKSGAGNNCI